MWSIRCVFGILSNADFWEQWDIDILICVPFIILFGQADRVHGLSHSALQTTRMAEADLDRRFARLSILLASRSQSLPSTLGQSSTSLSSYLPTSLSRPPPTTDPQDLLRALSRADAERPQSQVGDAAWRAAREAQRARDNGGISERRLTVATPLTPRKPPGTHRRVNTPGRPR